MSLHLHGHVDNIIHHLLPVLLIVGWTPAKHLVQQSTETPPVRRLAVAHALDDLGGEVFGRATVRVRPGSGLIRREALLRETKICYLDVAFMI